MSRILSLPATVSVRSYPYELPAAGRAVLVGTNTAASIRPSSHSEFSWNYSLFESYGGGCYVLDYSSGGAYALAGTGGHLAPANFGAALFDFEDATWKRLDNANGMPWRENDIAPGEANGNAEIAIGSVTPNAMPAPAHTYMNLLAIDKSIGGGARGSVAMVIRGSTLTSSVASLRSHRFDLTTRLWSRLSPNAVSNAVSVGGAIWPEAPSAYDPVTRRYFQLPFEVHAVPQIPYLDSSDWTWKSSGAMPAPSAMGSNTSAFVDAPRRMLIMQTSTGNLRAFNLASPGAGIRTLSVSGALPSSANRWHFYPLDGAFYTYSGSGQSLHRLAPPSGDPWTGTWAVTTRQVAGATLPSTSRVTSNGTRHYTRFFYVPPLQSFAWIGNGSAQVALIRP